MKTWLCATVGLFAFSCSLLLGAQDSGSVVALSDFRDYSLKVVAEHGAPSPVVGIHSNYCWQSSITCSVDEVTSDGWMFMGWSGDATTDYTETNIVVLMNRLSKSVTANFSDDADGDGLLNTNEFAIGTNPRNVDSDGDGMTDPDELVAGTSPTNSASIFKVGIALAYDNKNISWFGVAGRYYQITYADNLNGTWIPVGFIIAGEDAEIIIPDGGWSEARFYRVSVSLDPQSFN